MDIRELRIGDKVTYLGKVVTIRAIYNSGNVEFKSNDNDGRIVYISVPVENVQPIVLTDEIIKKIGFLNISNMWYHLDELVLLRRLKHNYQIYITDCGSHYEINKIIKYLHQLQHEIWEAGIELKIEL